MMINCPYCEIQFSPGYACCPRCKDFPTPPAERRDYLAEYVRTRISEGGDPAAMRDCLTENGFGDADADTLIRTAVSATRSETRSQGFRRFVAGLIMLGAGGLSAIVLLTGVRSGIVAFGVLIFLGGGTLATLSGIYSMLTGRESETAGNFVIRFEE